MTRPGISLCLGALLLSAAACALTNQPEPKKEAPPPTPPPAKLVVAEQFGPLLYRISPDLRSEWDRVLELHERLFTKQDRTVEEDDLHRLYNDADVNDDDVLDQTEIDEAFRQMKREYERYLSR